MSYFITTSGATVDLSGVEPVELIDIRDAQQYVRDLEDELSAADGTPLFLIHDGETGTSHNFVVEAEDRVHRTGSLRGSRLATVLERLVAAGNTFRICWASDSPAFPDAAQCHTLDQIVATIEQQVRGGMDLTVRYQPLGTGRPR